MNVSMRKVKAFTIIELIIVVTLIGVMAAFAIPNYNKAIAKAYRKDATVNLQAIYAAQKIYFNTNGNYYGGAGTDTASINLNLGLGIIESGGTTYTCPTGGAGFTCTASLSDGTTLTVTDTSPTPG